MAFSRKSAFGYLKRAHERDRLAHAYLISGPTGSGKRGLVTDLANLINGTKLKDIFAPNTAGILLAEPTSKSRRIVINQIRDIEHSLQLQDARQHRKIAIISEADRLQHQAANAFLKTLEEPPGNSLLLLLSALPEGLPETILSRCIEIPLAMDESPQLTDEETELIDLLRVTAREKDRGVQAAYRMVQGFQELLARTRQQIQSDNATALEREEARYKKTTEGTWLDEREKYYKALTESLYLQRRARLIEILFLWWSDVLRASLNIQQRNLPSAKNETNALAQRLTTAQILAHLRRLEKLREHLDRNIQEALALEVTFLSLEK